MANKTKDPVVVVQFGTETILGPDNTAVTRPAMRPLRWDYNTIAELQDLGFDFTPGSPDIERVQAGPKVPLRLMLAMATAALNSGSDDGRMYTLKEVGRIVTAEGDDCELFSATMDVRKLADGEDESRPLAESPAPNA